MDAPVKIAKELSLTAINDDKAYSEAQAKKSALRQKMRDIDSRIKQLSALVSMASMPLDEDEFNSRVEQALRSKDGSFDPSLDIASARLEMSRLKADYSVVRKAWSQQSEIVDAIRSELSSRARAKLAAEHQRVVARIAQAMDDLRTAASREKQIHIDLRALGYDSQLPSFHVPKSLDYYKANWGISDFPARLADYLK